jgi:HEAT repeat protein
MTRPTSLWLSAPLVLLSLAALVSPAVFAQQPDPADMVSVPQLMKNLDSDTVRIASSAARSLGVIFSPGGRGGEEKGEVVGLLIERLESPRGAELRRECAVALGRIRATEATEGLKKAMNDEDVDVAMAAGEAVGQILPIDEARVFLIEQGSGESELVQVAAYHGLAPIAKPEDADFLIRGLKAKNWRTQQAAVGGLERAVRAGAQIEPPAYDAAAGVLGSEITNAANAAVHFFTHVRNPESFRALVAAADTRGDGSASDTTWRNRTYALRAVYHLGWPSNRAALPVVFRNLGDPIANVSNEAKRTLYELRKDHHVSHADLFPAMLVELEKADSLPMRAGIMREMGSQVDRQFASRVAKIASATLEEASKDKAAWPARTYAITLLGASGFTGAMEPIARSVSDDVANVRQAAGRALEALSPVCPPEERAKVAPILQPLLATPVDWRKTAIAARAAGYYSGADAVDPLVKLLSHSVLNVRQGASHGLVAIIDRKDDALRTAVDGQIYSELAGNRRAWEFGSPILGALEDKKAIAQLTKILDEGDWRAQEAAARATARIAAATPINDEALSRALIRAAQSQVVQVQDAANVALRELTKEE